MTFIYLLGRFHVLILHLPIGIIIAVISLEWLARKPKYQFLETAAPFLWGAAAITAIVTASLGYLHYAEGGFEGGYADYHRLFGTLVAIVATVGWILRSSFEPLYKKAQIVMLVLLITTVTVAGHTGGSLTHGSTYLVQYAPQPIRSLAGLEPPRPKITDLAMADPYLDVVRPIMRNNCSSCHGNETRRNELSLYTYDMAMKGGKSGLAIKPADSAHSELFRRVSLPKDNKDSMPPSGKPPLTDSQIKIIGWWIQSGALTGTKLGKMNIIPEMKPLLLAELGLGSAGTLVASAGTAVHPADPKLVDNLTSAGFSVRQVSLSSPLLIVSLGGGGGSVTESGLQTLISARDQIEELNLQRSGVKDQQLKAVGQLAKLSQLHLEGNQISDSGVVSLAALGNLKYLNLYGNQRITDASIVVLSQMRTLQEVYLWDTHVTEHGAAELRRKHLNLVVDLGASGGARSGQPSPSHDAIASVQDVP
jgi:uncharacterized membrane protein